MSDVFTTLAYQKLNLKRIDQNRRRKNRRISMVAETVKEKFEDWYNLSTEELVGIVGMKWRDDRKDNFVTHSFFDQELLDKGYSLRKFVLRECLNNLYDNTHEDKTIDNPEASKEIDKILASVMKQIKDL